MSSMPSSSSSPATVATELSTRSTSSSSPYISFPINNQSFSSQPSTTTHDSSVTQPNALKQRRVSLALPSAPRVVKTPAFRDEMALSDSSVYQKASSSSDPNASGNSSFKSKFDHTDDMHLHLSQDIYTTFDESEGDIGTEGDLDAGQDEDGDYNDDHARATAGLPEQTKKKRGRVKKSTSGDVPSAGIASSSTTTSGIAPEKKPRKKWTDEETNELIKGCQKHGVGNWKTILQDKGLRFCDRTAVDLKDRFRTRFPDAYKDHYPNARTHLSSKVRSIQPDGTQLFTKMRNKKRRPFTPEEDTALKAGYEQHGTLWAVIARMPIFVLSGRKSTDLRDRFRNAYPDLYAAAGYKPRAYAGAGKEREKEREREREREKTAKDREGSEGADSASTPAASTGGTPGPPTSARSSRRPSTSSVTSPIKGNPTLLPGSTTPSSTTFSYKFRAVDDPAAAGPLSASTSTSTFPQSSFVTSSSAYTATTSNSTSSSSIFPATFLNTPSDGAAGPVRNRKRRHTNHGHLRGTRSVPQSAVCSEDESGLHYSGSAALGDGVFSDGEGPISPTISRNEKGKDRDRAVFKVPPLPIGKIKSQQGQPQLVPATTGRFHIAPPETKLQDATQSQEGDSPSKLTGRRGRSRSHRSHSLSPTKPSLALQPLPEGAAVGPNGGISLDDTMTASVNPYLLQASFNFHRQGHSQTPQHEQHSPEEPSKAERDARHHSPPESQPSRRDDEDSHALGLGMSELDLAMDVGGIDDLGMDPMMEMNMGLVSMDVDEQLGLGGLGLGMGMGGMGMDLDHHREGGRDVEMGGPEVDADPLDIPEFYPNGAHVGMEGHWTADGKTKSTAKDGKTGRGLHHSQDGAFKSRDGSGDKSIKEENFHLNTLKRDENNGGHVMNNSFGGTIGKSAWGARDWLSPNPRLDSSSSSPSRHPMTMSSAFFSPQTHHSESGEDTDTDMQDGDIDLEHHYDHDFDFEYDTSASVSANFSPASASVSLSGLSTSASASVSPLSSFNTLNHGVMDRYGLLAPSTSLHNPYSGQEPSGAMSDVGVGSNSDMYSHHSHHGFGNHYSSIGSLLSGYSSSVSAVGPSSGSGAQGYSSAYSSTAFGYGYNGAPLPGHYSQIAGDLISGRGGWGVGLGLVGLGLGSWEGGSTADVDGSAEANSQSSNLRRHGQAHVHTPSLTAINEMSIANAALNGSGGKANGEGVVRQRRSPDSTRNSPDAGSPMKNARGRKSERQLQGAPFLAPSLSGATASSHPDSSAGGSRLAAGSDSLSSKPAHSSLMNGASEGGHAKFEMSDLVDMTRVENLDAGVGSGSILVDAQQPHVVEGSRNRDVVDQDRHDQHQQSGTHQQDKDDGEQHATPPATPSMRQSRPMHTGMRRASQGAAIGLQSGFMSGFVVSEQGNNHTLGQSFNGNNHFAGHGHYSFDDGNQASMSHHARSVSVPPSEARNTNVDPGILFGSSYDDGLNGYSHNGYAFNHSQQPTTGTSFFNVTPSQLSSSSTLADALSPPRAMSHSTSSSSALSSTSSSSASASSAANSRRRHHHRASSASMYSMRPPDDTTYTGNLLQVQTARDDMDARNMQAHDSQNMLTPLFNSRLILSPSSPSALSPSTSLHQQSSEAEVHSDQHQHNPTTPRRAHTALADNTETPHPVDNNDGANWRPSNTSAGSSTNSHYNFATHGFSSGELSNVPYLDLHYFNNPFSNHGYLNGNGVGATSGGQTFPNSEVLGFEALDPAKSWQGLALDLAHPSGLSHGSHGNQPFSLHPGTQTSHIASYLGYQPSQPAGSVNPANLTSTSPTSVLKTVRQRQHVRPSIPLSMQIPKNLSSDGFLSPTHSSSRHNPLASGGVSSNGSLADTLKSMKDGLVHSVPIGSPPGKNATIRQSHRKLRSSSRSMSSGGYSLSRSGASTPVPGNTGGGANLTRSVSHNRGQTMANAGSGSNSRTGGPGAICPQELLLHSPTSENKRKRASWDGGLV